MFSLRAHTPILRRAGAAIAAFTMLTMAAVGLSGCVAYPYGYYAQPYGYAYAPPHHYHHDGGYYGDWR
jgi:hypothetical protein